MRTGSKKKLANAALDFQHDHSSGRRKPGWIPLSQYGLDCFSSIYYYSNLCDARSSFRKAKEEKEKQKRLWRQWVFVTKAEKRAGIGYYFLFFNPFKSVLLDQRYLSSSAVFIFSFIFFVSSFFLPLFLFLFYFGAFLRSIHPWLMYGRSRVSRSEKKDQWKKERREDRGCSRSKAQTSISSLVDQSEPARLCNHTSISCAHRSIE